jgi:hypothetical protein
MNQLFALVVLALSASASPILLSGYGSFEYGNGDGGGVNLYASSGSPYGENSVSFSISTYWPGLTIIPGSTEHGGMGGDLYSSGWASIGDIGSRYFNVTIGDAGELTLYDRPDGNVIASTPIQVYENVTVTHADYQLGFLLMDEQGEIALVSVPEPGTWVLISAGFLLLVGKLIVARKLFDRAPGRICAACAAGDHAQPGMKCDCECHEEE